MMNKLFCSTIIQSTEEVEKVLLLIREGAHKPEDRVKIRDLVVACEKCAIKGEIFHLLIKSPEIFFSLAKNSQLTPTQISTLALKGAEHTFSDSVGFFYQLLLNNANNSNTLLFIADLAKKKKIATERQLPLLFSIINSHKVTLQVLNSIFIKDDYYKMFGSYPHVLERLVETYSRLAVHA